MQPEGAGYSALAHNMAVATLFEVGNARYRVPTDAVAILELVVGLSLWRGARREARSEPVNSRG